MPSEIATALAVVAACFGGWWLLRRLEARRCARRLQLVESLPLGQDRVVAVVRVAGRLLLLGLTRNRIERLAEIEAAQWANPEADEAALRAPELAPVARLDSSADSSDGLRAARV